MKKKILQVTIALAVTGAAVQTVRAGVAVGFSFGFPLGLRLCYRIAVRTLLQLLSGSRPRASGRLCATACPCLPGNRITAEMLEHPVM